MRINITERVNSCFPPTGRAKTRNANIRQFAKAIDVTENAAANIYDGAIYSIRLDTLEKICRALKCEPSDVFEYEKDDTN